jgi:hypothetical protein
MATALYAFAQFSDGTFGSFANASVTAETATEIQTGGVGINQVSGVSIGQAFAGKTLVACSIQVQTDDAITGAFSYGYLLGPTGTMLCPVQGGNYSGVGLPRLKRPVRMAPGVKLYGAFDTGADAVSLATMAVYCASGKSAIFAVKAVDATKTSMTDILTGGTIGQSLAGERIVCSYQGYPANKGLNDNQAGNAGFYIESSDGQLKLMVNPSSGAGASTATGAAGDYIQGALPWVEYAVSIPIAQNDTLSVMAGL